MKTFIITCLIALVLSQTVATERGEQFNNPQFLKVINNYFGCKTWENGVCVQCSAHYFFNKNGICCEVKPECKAFNRAVGICEQCYQGYQIQNGQCVKTDLSQSSQSGCKTWSNGKCAECSARWFFNADGVCEKVCDLCRTWDKDNGNCLTCYNGYVVDSGKCALDVNEFRPSVDSLCAEWKGRVCLKCAHRAFFDSNGVCVSVSTNCATWDEFDGFCLTCYNGYDLIKGGCAYSASNNAHPADLGCKRWDWNKQICLECSSRWVFNTQGACVPVSDNCRQHSAEGACVSCYKGYDLTNGQCVFSASNNAQPSDLGCKTWDWNKQVCLECSSKWVFNTQGVCVPVSDNCRQHSTSGSCVSCYKGYDLTNGQCVFSASNNAQPSDLGCKTWDWNKQVCLECSSRWVFNTQGVCVPVSDNCKQHSAEGACVSCYKGYDLTNGQCVFSASNNAQPSDLGCKTWDWNKQVCLECSSKWVFNTQGVCVPVSDNCRQHSTSGSCVSCYKGYDLTNGQCVFSASNNAQPSDLGCKTWDWNKQVCLECSSRWVFNTQGVCVPVSDNCKQHSAEGACVSCYKGYDLTNGQCVFSASNNAQPSDLGCKTWDWNKQVCLECSSKWVFNTQGVCVPVSDNCRQHSTSGSCVSCYKGYDLTNGQCVFSASNNAQPSDLGCKTWDWNKQVCLECSSRWVFNTQGVCVPVSDNCKQHSAEGACVSCYKGYDLTNGQCVFSASNNAQPSDLGCKTWDWNKQVCLECSSKWVFNTQGVCVPVSDNCRQHSTSGSCVSCYKGYDLTNGQCVFSASNNAQPSDLGCKTWDWNKQVCLECSSRWVFNTQGVCVPVSDNCRQYSAQGVCTQCYNSYQLVNGNCEQFHSLCKSFGADGACSSCYNGYVLYQKTCTPLSKLADIVLYYSQCCPEKLKQLQDQGRL